MSDTVWAALALVLILEGLLPFISPGAWRRVFSEMLQMRDGQIRFFGLICLVAGASLWWAVA
ncbi:DUF2065 domain-containing protein [Hydrogenophaga sp. PAMC20947]|uniref:DUF2065 domain-containing protein n=1 Tax=Hydrogenophaga sp. PAMC20947 TaxID=2565558 RepID=UPI00109E17AF|nr:DUF2065 domain-containing protein [Hydrogenophaga sp. PAMC20947]QCB45262.1 DUF2065 domain-containing protein [Hydrogenophaga sp. PAMC20947]